MDKVIKKNVEFKNEDPSKCKKQINTIIKQKKIKII